MKIPKWLSRNVLFLGLVSLFTDAATELAMPLMPAFIAALGGGAMALGFIEGTADTVSSVLKLFAGRLSDRWRRRKPFVLFGYTLSSVARPFLALAATPWHIFYVRVIDRTGKGLRTAPRDALLAASIPKASRGAAFGFHQAMDEAGAALGALAAVALLLLTHDNLRLIFWIAAIPGALAVAAIVFGVKEKAAPLPKPGVQSLLRPSWGLMAFLLPLGLFTLGASSDLFLLWKAHGEGTPLYAFPLLWFGLHGVKASSTLAGGYLSDRIGERACISLGWFFYALIYSAFAFVHGGAAFIAVFLAYGLFHGLTAGAEKSLVTRLAPKSSHGSSFGWYHLTVGLLTLPANLLFGYLYDHQGPKTAFLTGAAFSLAGLALLFLLSSRSALMGAPARARRKK